MNRSNSIRPAAVAAIATGLSLALSTLPVRAQEPPSPADNRFVFLPGRMIAAPLTAADQEPRVGIRKEVGSSKLVLDIGSALDVVAFTPGDEGGGTFRAGIDFFTYALSTSLAGRRLQIDAVDGFFGGHIAFRRSLENPDLTVRLRILHRSAHFLDGHYDNTLQAWRDGEAPIPFTKDFGDLLVSFAWALDAIHLSIYSGISYSTLIRPVELRRFATIHGVEVTSGTALGNALGRPFVLFAAYNLSLDGIPSYVGTNTVMVGAKFGEWAGQGIRVLAGYRNGLEMFGQYYASRRDYWSLGLLFDVW